MKWLAANFLTPAVSLISSPAVGVAALLWFLTMSNLIARILVKEPLASADMFQEPKLTLCVRVRAGDQAVCVSMLE